MSNDLATDGASNDGAAPARKTDRLAVAREYAARRLRNGLYLPRGPKRLSHPDRQALKFRDKIEDEVLARHGEISFYAAARIQSATVALRHANLAAHWLRHEHETLDTAARLALSREVTNGLRERDRIMVDLGLDKPAGLVVQGGLQPQLWKDETE
jgi:hypothetical protein